MSTANRIILIAGMGTFSAVQTGTALAYQERVSLKKSLAAAQKALMNGVFKGTEKFFRTGMTSEDF